MRLLASLALVVCMTLGAPGAGAAEIEVRGGDTLGSLARRHGVTLRELTAANGLRSDAILRIGQKLAVPEPGSTPPRRQHTVVAGETLSAIARRYQVTSAAIVTANGLRSEDLVRIGQRLIVPGAEPPSPVATANESTRETSAPGAAVADPPERSAGMQTLVVPGAPPAYYFEPEGPGRLSMRPVIMYLHGRGAEPAGYCQRWAKVVRRLGWLVCPQGPEDRGGGVKRGWGGDYAGGRRVAVAALNALRAKHGRRVQLYGNTIVGFSEGAFMAMNVGLMEPRAFNRWLILAADTDYWGPGQVAALDRAKHRIHRVYLITGQKDVVFEETPKVRRFLTRVGVPVRVSTPPDLGHSVALESKPSMYKAALGWLGG